MHANQLTVSAETVRELVDEQFPEWQALPIRRIRSQGTVNAIFRVGDQLAARFPLQPRVGARQGVAFLQAMGAVWCYVESNPAMSLMGRRTLERITADDSRD